jgi:hypothetical protein
VVVEEKFNFFSSSFLVSDFWMCPHIYREIVEVCSEVNNRELKATRARTVGSRRAISMGFRTSSNLTKHISQLATFNIKQEINHYFTTAQCCYIYIYFLYWSFIKFYMRRIQRRSCEYSAVASSCTRVYPKFSGLAACSENWKWYGFLPLGAVVSIFCESV